MVERGYIRVLVVHSRTGYFLDGPRQKGITYEALKEFEKSTSFCRSGVTVRPAATRSEDGSILLRRLADTRSGGWSFR